MHWLQGGPYYELSFLLNNQLDKKQFIEEILFKLKTSAFNFQIVDSTQDLEANLVEFIDGYRDEDFFRRSININSTFEIAGIRKSRVFLDELSDEFIKLNFWFDGSMYDAADWNQKGLKDGDKPAFRVFFKTMATLLCPVLATIGYEEDCDYVFGIDSPYPDSGYSMKYLTIDKIKERINQNSAFEYCWINGSYFGKNENLEFERK